MNDSGPAALSAGAISARIDRLPATRTIWTIVALLGFGMFFELYDLLFSAYVAPSLVKSGVLTGATTGLFGTTGVASFIAALFTGLFIGTLLCGFLADRFGRRAIFTWSLLWYSAANLMVALQHDAAGLNFWRLISGVGLGVEMVTIGAYLSEIAPKRLRGRAFAINQAIGFVCVPVISFLAYILVPTAPLGLEGWRWVVLIGALAAPVVVFLRRACRKAHVGSPSMESSPRRTKSCAGSKRRSRRSTGGRCRRPVPRSRSRQRAAFGTCGFPAFAAGSS